jgi:hypothetical protein
MSNTKTLTLDPLVRAAEQVVASHGGSLRMEDVAEALSISMSSYHRYRKTGTIPWIMADKAAISLGLHPVLVWPEEWLDLDREWLETH